MAYSKAKIVEIGDYYLKEGESKTLEGFGITSETLYRLLRTNKNIDPDFVLKGTLKKIQERYTDKELIAISEGGRIIPGQGKVPIIDFSGDRFKIGFFTDPHIGGIYFNENYFTKMLEQFDKEKVGLVLCAGDVTEGMSNRPDQIYELSHIGYDAQKEYAIKILSQIKQPFKCINGNHDRWFIKSNGANIVKDICYRLKNAEWLGHDEGDVSLRGKTTIKLWHGEDASCFDDQTEILTKDGWKFFKNLSLLDEVATMKKNNHIFEWQKPLNIYTSSYSGDMIHFNSRTVDCMVTPNHGMWTRVSEAVTYRRKLNLSCPTKSHIRLNTKWHRKDAKDIYEEYSRQKWQLTKVCEDWGGETPEYISVPYRESKNKGKRVVHLGSVSTEDMAELMSWYVTEGHAEGSAIHISQYKKVNPENYARIMDLAKRLKVNYGGRDKCISLYSTELKEFLVAECGHLSRSKFLPLWLKNCDKNILQLVFDTMISGDGWRSPAGFGYRSISRKLLEDFSEIAIKLGYAVTFYGGDSVSVYNTQVTPTITNKPEAIKYNGEIYCCEVPNGLILIRRNGKILWTHNSYAVSYRLQKLAESFTGGEKPNIVLAGHTHKQGYFMTRFIHMVSGGAMSVQSRWMRSKKLSNDTGFWILEIHVNKAGISRFKSEWFPFYA
jgi:predicted phosphodiesterase